MFWNLHLTAASHPLPRDLLLLNKNLEWFLILLWNNCRLDLDYLSYSYKRRNLFVISTTWNRMRLVPKDKIWNINNIRLLLIPIYVSFYRWFYSIDNSWMKQFWQLLERAEVPIEKPIESVGVGDAVHTLSQREPFFS